MNRINYKQILCLSQTFYKNRFHFSLSNQDVRQHISKLIDLNETQISAKTQLEKETAELEIVQLEQELNQFLTQFNETQKQPYYLFRKNLVQLAYYSSYKTQVDQCQKYLKSVMLGDYLNTYQGDLLKAVFLAELHGILFLTNYDQRDEANILQTVKYWEDAVSNLQYFNDLMDDKPQSLNTFLQEIENVYVHQYIDNLIKGAKLCYRNGKLNISISLLRKCSLLTDNLLNIIVKQSNQPIEDEKYYNYYITELKKFQSTARVMLVKLFTLVKSIQDAKTSMLSAQNLIEKNNSLYIQLLIHQFDLIYINEYNEDDLELIEQEIEERMKQLEKIPDTAEITGEYNLFRIKYNLDFEDEAKQIEQFKQLNETQLIELQNHSIDCLMTEQQYQEAFKLLQKQVHMLETNYNSTHYLYEYTLALNYFVMIKLQKIEMIDSQLSIHINQLLNVGNIDFPQIIKFYGQQVKFQRLVKDNQAMALEILQELEKIQFQNESISYLKQRNLEICYDQLNLNDKLSLCLKSQLVYLANIYSNSNTLIEEIQEKIKQVNF